MSRVLCQPRATRSCRCAVWADWWISSDWYLKCNVQVSWWLASYPHDNDVNTTACRLRKHAVSHHALWLCPPSLQCTKVHRPSTEQWGKEHTTWAVDNTWPSCTTWNVLSVEYDQNDDRMMPCRPSWRSSWSNYRSSLKVSKTTIRSTKQRVETCPPSAAHSRSLYALASAVSVLWKETHAHCVFGIHVVYVQEDLESSVNNPLQELGEQQQVRWQQYLHTMKLPRHVL